MSRKIMVVDGTNLFIRNFAALPTTDSMGEHNGAIFGVLQSILSLWNKFESHRIFLIFDGYGGSVRRRKIYEDYKKRKTGVSIGTKFLYLDPEQQRQSFTRQMIVLKNVIKIMPIDTMTVDYVEADDVIAFLASCNKEDELVIVSTDRDYLQLVNGDLCKVWSPTKELLYDENKILEEFGVYPINFCIYKAFLGDSSDNIKGIKDFGPKTLIKTFPFLSENKKYELNDCFEYCEQQCKLEKHNKWYDILPQHKEQIEVNYKLMDLVNLDLSLSVTGPIIDAWHSAPKKIEEVSLSEFRNFLMINKFYELVNRASIYTKMVSKITTK